MLREVAQVSKGLASGGLSRGFMTTVLLEGVNLSLLRSYLVSLITLVSSSTMDSLIRSYVTTFNRGVYHKYQPTCSPSANHGMKKQLRTEWRISVPKLLPAVLEEQPFYLRHRYRALAVDIS